MTNRVVNFSRQKLENRGLFAVYNVFLKVTQYACRIHLKLFIYFVLIEQMVLCKRITSSITNKNQLVNKTTARLNSLNKVTIKVTVFVSDSLEVFVHF
jgi:hypothetical protein